MNQDKKSFTLLERESRHLQDGKKRNKFGRRLQPGQNTLTGFTHIKEVIDDIFTTSALPINFDDIRIWKVWNSVVGKKIAEHAQPSWIKKGVLLVKVTDSVWLQELEFMAEKIKEGLNTKIQREIIKKIRFKVGTYKESKQINKKRAKQENDHDFSPEKQREMEEILAQIRDKDLRSSLRQIMIARTKKVSGNPSD